MRPGAGCLEMACAALSQIKEAPFFNIQKIVCSQPLVIEDDTREAQVVLREENDQLCWQIQSTYNRGIIIHSKGIFDSQATSGN